MFLNPEELNTVLYDWQLSGITLDETITRKAILAAMGEVESYLAAKYDTDAIFATTGDARNVILLEHTKSIAVYYMLRLSNGDILFERVREYYKNAIDWLKQVAGITDGRCITPNLPLKKDSTGSVKIKMRMGSNPKFSHHFN